jgi:hypothetical protein
MDRLAGAKKDFQFNRSMKNTGFLEEKGEDMQEKEEAVSDELVKRIDKLESVLQDFGKFFMGYKDENTKKLAELSTAVSQLRDDVSNVRVDMKKVREVGAVSSAPAQSSSAPAQQASQEARRPNARTGTAKAGDFDISQVFSNSNNRLMKK